MGTKESKTGPSARPIYYEALIDERRKDRGGDDVGRRAEAARLEEIAENLRTLRERADEQAKPKPTDSDP